MPLARAVPPHYSTLTWGQAAPRDRPFWSCPQQTLSPFAHDSATPAELITPGLRPGGCCPSGWAPLLRGRRAILAPAASLKRPPASPRHPMKGSSSRPCSVVHPAFTIHPRQHQKVKKLVHLEVGCPVWKERGLSSIPKFDLGARCPQG